MTVLGELGVDDPKLPSGQAPSSPVCLRVVIRSPAASCLVNDTHISDDQANQCRSFSASELIRQSL